MIKMASPQRAKLMLLMFAILDLEVEVCLLLTLGRAAVYFSSLGSAMVLY